MSKPRWYGLLVETPNYAPGAHFVDWDTEFGPELTKYRVPLSLIKKCSTEAEAVRWVNDNPQLVDLHHGSDRIRHARTQGGRCWYCGHSLDMKSVSQADSAELEHQTPASQGGYETVTSCRACNNPADDGKGNRTLEEYRDHLLAKNHPGKTRLHFYGEWLTFRKSRPNEAVAAVAQAFVGPDDALAFPAELFTDSA